MRISRLLATSAFAALMMGAASSAQAQDAPVDVAFNVGFTTDYVFRGVSQNDEKPTFQGGVDVTHESGLFVGAWASEVDYGSDADAEIDLYAGYSNEVGAFSYSASGLYYMYADESALNYLELGLTGAYEVSSWLNLTGGAYWTPDFGGYDGDAWYLTYGVAIGLGESLTLELNSGWNGFENFENYLDTNIGLVFAAGDVTFDLRYHNTDQVDNGLADDRIVLSVGYVF